MPATGPDYLDCETLLTEEQRLVRDTVRSWVEEKVLPARQGLTIGSAPRNTIVVTGAGAPSSLTVFAWLVPFERVCMAVKRAFENAPPGD